MIEGFGNEFKILLEITKEEMVAKNVDKGLMDLILLNREGKLKVKPGYDGEYGVLIQEDRIDVEGSEQAKLF